MSDLRTPATSAAPGWFVFGLMASVTFVGLLSELLPSGVLPQMAGDLGVSDARIGMLVGGYALASALTAIPLVSATLPMDRKRLLMVLLAGFAISNIAVGLSSSYGFILGARIVGGICAGVMWPMIAAYGSRLVPPEQQGRAITVIMAGNTLGISIGLPVFTWLGLAFGWRTEFIVLGLGALLTAVLGHFHLPALQGEARGRGNSPLVLLKNPPILVVMLLTLLSVVAHYAVYTYISLLVESADLAGGIGGALAIFGVGSVISVLLAARYIDAWLRGLVVSMLALGAMAMVLLLAFAGIPGIAHLAFFLWGISFGPLVTMYQAAVARRVDRGRDVATSLQSSVFNFSIMVASWVGGVMLVRWANLGVSGIVWLALGCFAVAAVVAWRAESTLRQT